MSQKNLRLDQLLVERGLAPTRQKAQGLILAGQVLANDIPVTKAGARFGEEVQLRIRGDLSRFVGRGGDKLQGAVDHFKIALGGETAIDVGASTGGFTDCMLQSGAAKVYAVDVGYNQLDQKLRGDPRVVVMERNHAKDLRRDMFDPLPSFATIDVSFISVRKVLDFVIPVMTEQYRVLLLVKPQFEVGREDVGKGGVVKEESLQLDAVEEVAAHARSAGLTVEGSVASTLKGSKKGNQEYFLLLRGANKVS